MASSDREGILSEMQLVLLVCALACHCALAHEETENPCRKFFDALKETFKKCKEAGKISECHDKMIKPFADKYKARDDASQEEKKAAMERLREAFLNLEEGKNNMMRCCNTIYGGIREYNDVRPSKKCIELLENNREASEWGQFEIVAG